VGIEVLGWVAVLDDNRLDWEVVEQPLVEVFDHIVREQHVLLVRLAVREYGGPTRRILGGADPATWCRARTLR
jgi:hypothetical protein